MRDRNLLNIFKSVEGKLWNLGNTVVDIYNLEAFGDVGRVGFISAGAEDITKPSDSFILEGRADERQSYFFKVVAIRKSADTDYQRFCIGIRNVYFFKERATECVISYINNAFGDFKIGNAGVCKGIIEDSFKI